VSYIASRPAPGGGLLQASVLIGRGTGGEVEELYRIRLPVNSFSERGIILGEGKSENQNHAIVFTRGEAIQARRPP
jgi:1,3-beta-glucan synthase component